MQKVWHRKFLTISFKLEKKSVKSLCYIPLACHNVLTYGMRVCQYSSQSYVSYVNISVNLFLLHRKFCYVMKICQQICLHGTHEKRQYIINILLSKVFWVLVWSTNGAFLTHESRLYRYQKKEKNFSSRFSITFFLSTSCK